jgi:N-acetylglucosamine kinase-like BadF-type ATPase
MKVLAIDAGGTKSHGVLFNEKGEILAETVTGPAALQVDFALALKSITECVDYFEEYDKIVIGMSGAFACEKADQFKTVIESKYGNIVTLMDDIELSYYSHFGHGNGVAVVAGTGSVVFAKDDEGFHIHGGWGYLLGDEGSAYSISKTIIQETLKSLENGISNELTMNVLKVTNSLTRNDLISNVYSLTRTEFAALAKEFASIKDTSITECIELEALKLANVTLRAINAQCKKVHISGSVFKNPIFKNYYLSHLFDNGVVEVINDDHENVYGGYRYTFNK